MPNIIFNNYCNRRCPYCFALETMNFDDKREMRSDEFIILSNILERSHENQNIGILGGEPTLHSRFLDMLMFLLRGETKAVVFTNGLCSDSLMEEIDKAVNEGRFRFMVNVNPPGIDSELDQRRQENFIERYRRNCDIGVNIFRKDIDILFAADLIKRVRLNNAGLRIGFAQPIPHGTNEFLDPGDYRIAAKRVVELAQAVYSNRIVISFDCGIPLCAFSNCQLGLLAKHRAKVSFHCSPIIDLAPGSQSWHCFPLSRTLRYQYNTNSTVRQIRQAFERKSRQLKSTLEAKGIYDTCTTCKFREHGSCSGGCLAHIKARSEKPSDSTAA